jgi:hypothetical protein
VATPGDTKAAAAASQLQFECEALGLPVPVREYKFAAPDRQWRFDLAWPELKLAIEIEGLIFPQRPRWNEAPTGHQLDGRHVSVVGYLNDLEKLNDAWSRGWAVARVVHAHVANGDALALIRRRLAAAGYVERS